MYDTYLEVILRKCQAVCEEQFKELLKKEIKMRQFKYWQSVRKRTWYLNTEWVETVSVMLKIVAIA